MSTGPKVLNRLAGLAHTGEGADHPVIGVAVVRIQPDQPVEIQDGLVKLLALDKRQAPDGQAPMWSGSISRRAPKSLMASP